MLVLESIKLHMASSMESGGLEASDGDELVCGNDSLEILRGGGSSWCLVPVIHE